MTQTDQTLAAIKSALKSIHGRLKALEMTNGRPGEEHQPPKPMRIRVKATAIKNGYSVEATLENTELVDAEWAERLEEQAMTRLVSVMANLNNEFPREA